MSNSSEFGEYFGRLLFEPLPDGRLMRVVEPFGFTDASNKRWPVPPGTKVDGASIPRSLWTLIGGPFEGKYRDASVIHDYYCDVRIEPWKDVHRIFYSAMRASGVSERRAKLMYAAVYFAGPRWSDTVVENSRLPIRFLIYPDRERGLGGTEFNQFSILSEDHFQHLLLTGSTQNKRKVKIPQKATLSLKEIEDQIGSKNLSLRELEALVDATAGIDQELDGDTSVKRVINADWVKSLADA